MPKINQKVSLRIPEGPWKGLYSTYVEGVDQSLTVAHPMYGGGLIPLPRGEDVLVEYIDGGERLAFPTQVLGYLTQVVPILSLALPAPGSIRRHQQRDFVRLDTNLSLYYRPVPEKPPEEGQEEPAYERGRTMDISGGGAQILAHQSFPVGTKLELLLHLQEADLLIQGEVVRMAQHPSPKEVWLGVRFVSLGERDRERIVRYIFSEQRSRRQKGLL